MAPAMHVSTSAGVSPPRRNNEGTLRGCIHSPGVHTVDALQTIIEEVGAGRAETNARVSLRGNPARGGNFRANRDQHKRIVAPDALRVSASPRSWGKSGGGFCVFRPVERMSGDRHAV